jgi:hypothetical protein
MTRAVLLNNVDHRDLHVHTRRGAAFGDAVMAAPTFPAEFRSLQVHYPIVFQATTTGSYQPLALFGLREGENLFLDGNGWDAHYVPLAITRQPFLIGRDGDGLVVHVDLDHPRVRRIGDGEGGGGADEAPADDATPVFLPHGGTSPFLERITGTLSVLHQGMQSIPAFVDALREHNLLESFVVDMTDAGGQQHRLAGFHTIHEERLAALDGAALERLQRAGHLQPIYMVLASLSNLRALVARREARQRADANAADA